MGFSLAVSDEFETFWSYLAEPSTLIAVIGPFFISALLLVIHRKSLGGPYREAVVLGTLVSILVAYWEKQDVVLSLHLLPGYPLVLVFLPRIYRPRPAVAYALCFFSMLTADLARVYWYAAAGGSDISDPPYLGIGGAGVLDALFLVPILCAIVVALFERAERSPNARLPLLAVARAKLQTLSETRLGCDKFSSNERTGSGAIECSLLLTCTGRQPSSMRSGARSESKCV